MGLDLNYRSSLGGDLERQYANVSKTILKDNPELTSEIKPYFEKTKEFGKEIFDQLEDFLKSNNIESESGLHSSF
jgi:hypothetical protein